MIYSIVHNGTQSKHSISSYLRCASVLLGMVIASLTVAKFAYSPLPMLVRSFSLHNSDSFTASADWVLCFPYSRITSNSSRVASNCVSSVTGSLTPESYNDLFFYYLAILPCHLVALNFTLGALSFLTELYFMFFSFLRVGTMELLALTSFTQLLLVASVNIREGAKK